MTISKAKIRSKTKKKQMSKASLDETTLEWLVKEQKRELDRMKDTKSKLWRLIAMIYQHGNDLDASFERAVYELGLLQGRIQQMEADDERSKRCRSEDC